MGEPRPEWDTLSDRAAEEMLQAWRNLAEDLVRCVDPDELSFEAYDPALRRREALNIADRLYATMLADRIAADPRPDDEFTAELAAARGIMASAGRAATMLSIGTRDERATAGERPTPVRMGLDAPAWARDRIADRDFIGKGLWLQKPETAADARPVHADDPIILAPLVNGADVDWSRRLAFTPAASQALLDRAPDIDAIEIPDDEWSSPDDLARRRQSALDIVEFYGRGSEWTFRDMETRYGMDQGSLLAAITEVTGHDGILARCVGADGTDRMLVWDAGKIGSAAPRPESGRTAAAGLAPRWMPGAPLMAGGRTR